MHVYGKEGTKQSDIKWYRTGTVIPKVPYSAKWERKSDKERKRDREIVIIEP
jgi:hypothetical protein